MATNTAHASSTHVQLSPSTTPGYTHADGLTAESAKKASDLLTINHAAYHTRWKGTFHNHITHHLVSLWALGASPDEIQDLWDFNTPYQTPLERDDAATAASGYLDLKDPAVFDQCLGKDECYADFLKFFEEEVEEKGMQDVVREYVLRGDARADDIFCRMYTDLVHPMIHLGCGLEFHQPSLVAEALAAACVHDNYPATFLLPTEAYVRANPGTADASPPLLQTLQALHNDPAIAGAVQPSDPFNKIPDGLLTRITPAQLVPYLSQFRVAARPADLARKLADMLHTGAYVAGAAQRPGKREAVDFVLLHCVTLGVFYPAILALDWLSDGEKARLLEAKGRVDAVMYAGCGCPPLYAERVRGYVPRFAGQGWEELFRRAVVYRDEGHVAKLVRALFCAERLGDTAEGFPVERGEFVRIAHMAVDSAERALEPGGHTMPEEVVRKVAGGVGGGGEMVTDNMKRWVFYGGVEGAWKYVPDLEGVAVE
ncbi:hypothetical protein BU26DRAFT_573978 [Trematosphaeria pertusa]|uniref:Oxidoreductase AflY n=1 Tax=Trematosphaeria pertusa TaxID=390896 RepID=A0A6A6IZT5_9PLEO|nr:uncharacterized protein BU26DRAFT_573978 [Trematosphaeria pertusa]KAF2256105.1 hypothetical protein BU26DRAFT_573978 [Trematosphaeria pertusa]